MTNGYDDDDDDDDDYYYDTRKKNSEVKPNLVLLYPKMNKVLLTVLC